MSIVGLEKTVQSRNFITVRKTFTPLTVASNVLRNTEQPDGIKASTYLCSNNTTFSIVQELAYLILVHWVSSGCFRHCIMLLSLQLHSPFLCSKQKALYILGLIPAAAVTF